MRYLITYELYSGFGVSAWEKICDSEEQAAQVVKDIKKMNEDKTGPVRKNIQVFELKRVRRLE